MKKETSDLLLIKKLLKKDYCALSEVMDIYSGRLYYYCLGMLKNEADAEEVVQDTFIKVYTNISKYRMNCKFSTWIYKIASNTVKDKLRSKDKKKTKLTVSCDEASSEDNFFSPKIDRAMSEKRLVPDNIMQANELNSIIVREVDKLPQKYREVLLLRHIENYSYAEISKILGCTVGTIKSRISRARSTLREQLTKNCAFIGENF